MASVVAKLKENADAIYNKNSISEGEEWEKVISEPSVEK